MLRAHSSIVIALSLSVAGCAVGPVSGQEIGGNTIEFDGFVRASEARVRLEAFDYGLDRFVALRTVTAERTATFAAGQICPDSPALYRYRGSITLNWPIYWDNNNGQYETKVRGFEVTSGEIPLFFTENENPGPCFAEHGFNSTCNFNNLAVSKCGFELNEAVVKTTDPSPWF